MDIKKTLIGGFIAFIMITSVLGFIYSGEQGAQEQQQGQSAGKRIYNDYIFLKTGDGWTINLNKQDLFLDYLPDELTEIDFSANLINLANKEAGQGKAYIITNGTDLGYVKKKFAGNLRILGIRAVDGCFESMADISGCEELPIINCGKFAVAFKLGDEEEAGIDNKCILFEGDAGYLNKAADKFVLNLLGIN